MIFAFLCVYRTFFPNFLKTILVSYPVDLQYFIYIKIEKLLHISTGQDICFFFYAQAIPFPFSLSGTPISHMEHMP